MIQQSNIIGAASVHRNTKKHGEKHFARVCVVTYRNGHFTALAMTYYINTQI